MNKEEIAEYYRWLGKLSNQKSPRTKKFYQEIQKLSVIKRRVNKKIKEITE